MGGSGLLVAGSVAEGGRRPSTQAGVEEARRDGRAATRPLHCPVAPNATAGTARVPRKLVESWRAPPAARTRQPAAPSHGRDEGGGRASQCAVRGGRAGGNL
eukprot:scaffold17880_cov27-Tisochrysis_lutea.AAC.2